ASSLAQFSGVYPSAGSFITYITRAIGTKGAVATGVISVLGYIIAFGGIYIFVGSYIVENVFHNVHFWGVTPIVTILYRVLALPRPCRRARRSRADVRRPRHGRAVRGRGGAAARAQPDYPGQRRRQRPVRPPVHLAGREGERRAAGVLLRRAGIRRLRGGRAA